MPTRPPDTPLATLRAMLGPNVPDEAACAAYEDALRSASSEAEVTDAGYRAGVVWKALVQETLLPAFALGYITAFYATSSFRLHAHSLIVAHVIDKYAPEPARAPLVAGFRRFDGGGPQGLLLLPAAGLSGLVQPVGVLSDSGSRRRDTVVVAAGPEAGGGSRLTVVHGASSTLPEPVPLPHEPAALLAEIDGMGRVLAALGGMAARQRDGAGAETLHRLLGQTWDAALLCNASCRELPGFRSPLYAAFRAAAGELPHAGADCGG